MQVGVSPKSAPIALDRDLKILPGHVDNAAAWIALLALRAGCPVLDDADKAVLTADDPGWR